LSGTNIIEKRKDVKWIFLIRDKGRKKKKDQSIAPDREDEVISHAKPAKFFNAKSAKQAQRAQRAFFLK
jgi:hypothetical protein